jgi:hypothetical protein
VCPHAVFVASVAFAARAAWIAQAVGVGVVAALVVGVLARVAAVELAGLVLVAKLV